jgi:hypothetical protein
MQFANATVQLMSPWAKIDHVVTASELLHTEFGEEVISAIHEDKAECLESYNDGVKLYPESKIPLLHNDELPVKTIGDSYSPRALLLTLLARLVGCDLFIHGTGGMKYDRAMEYWCNRWLGVSPCGATMATATLRLPLACNKFTESRRSYHTPPFAVQTKQQYVRKIQQAPYKSPERQFLFEQMHRWLSSVQEPLDVVALKEEVAKALRRDWAFSLYADQQLLALQEAIV